MSTPPRISSLDLRQIRLLYLLLTQRSVSRVADLMGISQPAVSLSLARLREVFSDPLLVRAGGTMVPTARGESLVQPISTLLDASERLAPEPEGFDPSMSLRGFSIASPNYLNALLLPQLTADLLSLAPNIRLNVRTALYDDDLVAALADGRTDLLIANWRQLSGHLKTAPLLEDRPVCIMARNHPYAALDRLSLPEYLTLDHISPTSLADARYSPIDEELARLGAKRRINMVMPDYMLLPLIVARTRHVLTSGARFGAFAARMASVKVVDAPPELGPIQFRMLWHERSHCDPAHQWLRGVIRATAKSTLEPTTETAGDRSAVPDTRDALAPQHLGEDHKHRR